MFERDKDKSDAGWGTTLFGAAFWPTTRDDGTGRSGCSRSSRAGSGRRASNAGTRSGIVLPRYDGAQRVLRRKFGP